MGVIGYGLNGFEMISSVFLPFRRYSDVTPVPPHRLPRSRAALKAVRIWGQMAVGVGVITLTMAGTPLVQAECVPPASFVAPTICAYGPRAKANFSTMVTCPYTQLQKP